MQFESEQVEEDINELNHLRDGMSSLMHRVSELEATINKKIDRTECLSIIQTKPNQAYVKQLAAELEGKIKEEQKIEDDRYNKMQEIAIAKIE